MFIEDLASEVLQAATSSKGWWLVQGKSSPEIAFSELW